MAKDKKSLEETIAQIRKTYGPGSVLWMDGRDQPVRKIEVVPSGSLALDIALGGGFPKGRIVEIYGGEATGKSSLCLHLIAEAQKRGMTAAFIDVENALDPEYAKALGVRLEDMLIVQPSSGEEAMDIAEKLIRGGDIGVVIVDSVAALASKAELEGSIGDSHVGLQARLLSQACRMLSGAIAKSNAIVVFTNQTRASIGIGGFGPKTTTSGGKALGYYSSVRIKTWNYGKIEDGDNRIFFKLQDKAIPFIACNRSISGIQSPKVVSNNFYGGFLATKHLLEQGYERIAFIANIYYSISVERYQGYIAALSEAGIEVNEEYVIFKEYSSSLIDLNQAKKIGYENVNKLLNLPNKPDAFFCIDDTVAQGAYYAITEKGFHPGRDIGLVGYNNNSDICKSLPGRLTSVDFNSYKVGNQAAKLILNIIHGEKVKKNITIVIQPELKIGNSSKKISIS